ncbi:cytochrome c oxidase subunit II [Tardiphaga sp.]|jgi:cytochrome c oxidase subunit 2|uniref:cytochrome c oxidase subunit II n=1 Tax=Tardiphaga sp. TaxID=1926292 RepID=UPI0037DA1A64
MTHPRAAVVMMCWLLAGCSGSQSVIQADGAPAMALRQLIIGIVSVCSLVWMLVMIALIWALMRRRGEPGSHDARQRRMAGSVIVAILATVVVIAGFTFASFYTTRALQGGPADVTIAVRGQQWWWELSYVAPDPSHSFKTANEIRIPVGRNVKLELDSADVVHSFWVPSLAGKLDLIPGRMNELTLRAERAGVYRGQCAEFCGTQHAHMALFVIAMEPKDYDDWVDSQRRDAAAPSGGEASAGEQLFLSMQCAACHTVRGTSAHGGTGPDLTHIASRQTIAAGLLETTRGSVAAWIADPQTLKPGNNMPMVPLDGNELRQLSAYMMSLK